MNKSDSNRINALKSTGPKTPRGKQSSRQNARRHGFFSRELHLSEHDRPEFEELRRKLAIQLKPRSPLQEIAFQAIVSCCWRCKLAHRLEAKQFATQLRDAEDKDSSTPERNQNLYLAQWYGGERMTIREGIRELKTIEEEFRALGYFKDDTKEYLARRFGSDFVVLLTKWTPMCKDAILLANQLVSHAQTFDLKNPNQGQTPADLAGDPQLNSQMIEKLLEQQRQFLEQILPLKDQLSTIGGLEARFEFNPRFLAAANRDLQRAVEWFFDLREKQL